MSDLLDGGTWWAAIEGRHGLAPTEPLEYAKVIAWQRTVGDDGHERLVAWINGLQPIRSDQFGEVVTNRFINHFTASRPQGSKEFNWA